MLPPRQGKPSLQQLHPTRTLTFSAFFLWQEDLEWLAMSSKFSTPEDITHRKSFETFQAPQRLQRTKNAFFSATFLSHRLKNFKACRGVARLDSVSTLKFGATAFKVSTAPLNNSSTSMASFSDLASYTSFSKEPLCLESSGSRPTQQPSPVCVVATKF